MKANLITAVAVAVLGAALPASAQTEPATLPMLTPADVTFRGSFTVPVNDGQPSPGGDLVYGGYALGLGPDGKSVYWGCHDWLDRLARVTRPGPGGAATLLDPCRDVAPGIYGITGSGNGMTLGGTMAIGGRFFVGANTYYSSEPQPTSLWMGQSLAAMRGPFRVGTGNQRTFAGYFGTVPPEFRALFGGDVISGKCCTSIISNSSYGPALNVWDSATVEQLRGATQLLEYPDNHQTVGGYLDPGGLVGFGHTTTVGGVAMVPGTNTTLFIGRQGTTVCYGTGTTDPTLHGKPSGDGGIWCYDPTNTYKGNHGYPYLNAAWFYRTSDLLDVARQLKARWDVRPVQIAQLPGTTVDTGQMVSATYDPATGDIMATLDTGGAQPRIYVWNVKPGTQVPGAPANLRLRIQ